MQIVIPSYTPHFDDVVIFLRSLQRHCVDIKEVTINIVISEHEKKLFYNKIYWLSNKLNICVYTLKELVKDVFDEGIEDEVKFREKVGKYNTQCLAKLVGLYKVANPYTLLFDSETLAIRDFSCKELFYNYFNKEKTIFYSDNSDNLENFNNSIYQTVSDNCLELIGQKKGCRNWFLEAYNWFFDGKILHDIFTYIEGLYKKNIFELMCEKFNPIFETPLYYSFIYSNNNSYKYNFININKELEQIEGYKEYQKLREKLNIPTIFEFHIRALINENMVNLFKEFYKNRNLQFVKFGLLNEKEYSPYMKQFIESTDNIIFLCTMFYKPKIDILGERL